MKKKKKEYLLLLLTTNLPNLTHFLSSTHLLPTCLPTYLLRTRPSIAKLSIYLLGWKSFELDVVFSIAFF